MKQSRVDLLLDIYKVASGHDCMREIYYDIQGTYFNVFDLEYLDASGFIKIKYDKYGDIEYIDLTKQGVDLVEDKTNLKVQIAKSMATNYIYSGSSLI